MILGIENSGAKLTVDYVKNVLLQGIMDEKANGSEKAMAAKCFNASKGGAKKRKCFTCGSVFHLSFECKQNKKKRKCFNCGKTSHLFKDCRLPKRKQDDDTKVNQSKNAQSKDEQPKGDQNNDKEKVLVALFNSELITDEMKEKWFVDSGASSHMTNRKDILQNLRAVQKKEILIANSAKLEGNLIGDVKLKLQVAEEEMICTIRDILYVPNLCANLISVNQLNRQGNSVLFEAGNCHIMSKDGELVATAKQEGNMYELNIQEKSFAFVSCEQEDMKDAYLWHRRLGHLSLSSMKFLKNAIGEIDIPSCKCIVCIKGKQTREPFNGKGKKADECLQLIHSDVVGPMPIESLGGCKYFVTFIDDYSKKLSVYPLKQKSEVFEMFTVF